MDAFLHQSHSWRLLIVDAFKPKIFKKWREVILDVLGVDSGFKPGLLWDYSTLPQSRLQQLLTSARGQGLLVNSLTVVTIEMDVMILNLEVLREGRLTPVDRLKAVDVSWRNKEPVIVEDISVLETTLLVYDDIVQKGQTDVIPCRGRMFNPTSLFGLLLGYPVVYWYPMEEDIGTQNCLGYEPLQSYKVLGQVKGKMSERDEGTFVHTVYSFSIPECVASGNHGDCDNSTLVLEWYEMLLNGGKWNSVFSGISLQQEKVLLPSVCL